MITYYVDNSNPTTPRAHAAREHARLRGLPDEIHAPGARRRRRGPRPHLRPVRRRDQPDGGHVAAVHDDLSRRAITYNSKQIRKVNLHVGVRSETMSKPTQDYVRNHISTSVNVRSLASVDRYNRVRTGCRGRHHAQSSNERGIAMITTLLVLMLMSALLVGFTTVVMSDQRYRFIDRDRGQAFYAASGGDREADRRSRQSVSLERGADGRAGHEPDRHREQAGPFRASRSPSPPAARRPAGQPADGLLTATTCGTKTPSPTVGASGLHDHVLRRTRPATRRRSR